MADPAAVRVVGGVAGVAAAVLVILYAPPWVMPAVVLGWGGWRAARWWRRRG